MAYVRKQRGKWRAEIEVEGIRQSKSWPTKAAAVAWAAATETAMRVEARNPFPTRTLTQALDRYSETISIAKRGARWEQLRLSAFARTFPKLAEKRLADIHTDDLAGWRDARLKLVSKGSVQREINLLRNVFSIAVAEWKWLGESPFKGLRMPGENPPRTRLVTPGEVKRVCRWLGYRTGAVPVTGYEQVALAFMIALRTGMRAGEVLQLGRDTVDLKRQVATVSHKMQHLTGRPREVPLSTKAVRLLRPQLDRDKVFTISGASLDALFRKARDALLIEGLHFHDTRADALTRFARRVDVLQLARISGHRDLKTLNDHYYRDSASTIAMRLG